MMEEYIITFLTMVSVAIVNKMTHIFDTILKKDKKRLKWINFLRYNDKINSCVLYFNKSNEKSLLLFACGNILFGTVITIIFIIVVLLKDGSTQSPYRSLVYVSFATLLIISFLHAHIDKCTFNIKSYMIFKKIRSKFDFLSGSTIISTLTIPSFLFIILINQHELKYSDFILYFLIIALLLLLNIISQRTHKNLIDKLELISLEKYSEAFPHIYVKADARELQGKVQDIFNDNFIVFGYNGLKIPVEWSKITSIKLSEIVADETEIFS